MFKVYNDNDDSYCVFILIFKVYSNLHISHCHSLLVASKHQSFNQCSIHGDTEMSAVAMNLVLCIRLSPNQLSSSN